MLPKRERLEIRKLEAEVLDLEAATSHHAHRCFTFTQEITTKSARQAIYTIGDWARTDPTATIKIFLCSPGGFVFEGLALHDFLLGITEDGTPLHIKAYGCVASMASVLLQAASVRSISPNSWLMIHEISGAMLGRTSQMRDEVNLIERVEELMLDILARRSSLSAKQILQRSRRKDWWLSATEALELGFVDEIL